MKNCLIFCESIASTNLFMVATLVSKLPFMYLKRNFLYYFAHDCILPQGLLSSRPLNRNWFPIVSTRYHLGLEVEFMLGAIHKRHLLKEGGRGVVKASGFFIVNLWSGTLHIIKKTDVLNICDCTCANSSPE
jgi:membrane-associated phospholipid phosphatase